MNEKLEDAFSDFEPISDDMLDQVTGGTFIDIPFIEPPVLKHDIPKPSFTIDYGIPFPPK